MTSSEGLLSLVNQLQNMETAMGLFLIETALKLSTFHDTKFFVMVDLPEGRKIAGKGEMIQCFLDGKLLPSQSDVKIELMPEVSALMEYPVREMENNMKQEPRPFRPLSQPSGFRQPTSGSSSFENNSPSAMSVHYRSPSFDASSRMMGMKSPKIATSAAGTTSPHQQHQQHHLQQHHPHHQTPTPAESPYGCGSAPMSPMPLSLQHHPQQQQQQRKRPSPYDPPLQQQQGHQRQSSSPKALKIEGRDVDEDASVIGDEEEEDSLHVMYPDDHGSGGGSGGGGADDYPIPAPVSHVGGGGIGNRYSPFHHPYQSYHQADLNSEDQTNRIAMAQQFTYDEVKAKDSTGFKVIASIVYAKAKELAADCPIADYKGPEVNNYLRQEYLAWFAHTFPRLYDTKATALFRARMQICFQTIRKKLFPPPSSSHGPIGGGGSSSSSSMLSMMSSDVPASAGNGAGSNVNHHIMGGTGYPDRSFGVQSLVTTRRDENNHQPLMGHSGSAGHERTAVATTAEHHHQHHDQQQHQQQHRSLHQQSAQLPPSLPQPHQATSQQHHHQQHHQHHDEKFIPEREESSESVDVKCTDIDDGSGAGGGGGGDCGGVGVDLSQQDISNTNMASMGMNSFIDVAGDRGSNDPYHFGHC